MIGGLPATAAGLAVGAAVNEKADLVRIEVRDAAGAVAAEAQASGGHEPHCTFTWRDKTTV